MRLLGAVTGAVGAAVGAVTGAVGTFLVALCCLGWAPALAALGAVGLGFLIDDRILFPLLAVFLVLFAVSIAALRRARSDARSDGGAR